MNKERFLNKTVAIFILAILLALVSGVAIGFGVSHEGRGERSEKGGRFSEMNGREKGQMNPGYVDDNNQNPNDAEVQDDQATTTASTTVTVQVKK